MRKTKKLALTLSVLGTALAALAAANLDLTSASAATVNQGNGIFMNYGASVRCSVEDDKNSGIRYELRLTTTAYEAIANANETATFGVLIAPSAYENKAALNAANVFGVGGTKVYNWAEWSEEEGGYVYEAEENMTRIVNVSTTVDFETTNLKTKTVEGVEYYYYYGALTGILPQNLANEFVGVGYVSTSETDYTFATRNDNARSIAYVAQQSILKDTTNLGATEEAQAKAKSWLQQNYVDEVADVATKYTVEHRLATNIGGGYTVLDTDEVTTTIDEDIELEEKNLEGLTATAADTNDKTAMANNRSALVVNYTYSDNVNVKLQGNSSEYYAFKNHAFYWLTEDNKTEFTGNENGIFYNGTSEPRTISVSGSYGAAAIVDANGIVIEGRDGANGRLVNAENPVRTSAPQGTLSTTEFAQNMTIPAGGFAITAQNQSNGTSTNVTYGVSTATDKSLRDFMLSSIISNYGNCVQIAVNGTNFTFTQYQPSLKASASGNVTTYLGTTEDAAKAAALEGLTVKAYDTFESTGTVVTDYTAEVTSTGGYSSAATGSFVFTVTVSDGNGKTTTLTRTVEVLGKTMTVTIGANSKEVDEDTAFFVLDGNSSSISSWADAFYLVTPEFKAAGKTLNTASNTHGEAFVLDQYGKIVRIYDGANAKYYDASNTGGVQNGTCSANGYLSEAYGSLQEGEYLLIAPSISPNQNNPRAFLLSNRTIGAQVSLIGVDKTVTFATEA